MAGGERTRVIIYGRVQGVFFRASTQEKATELGLTGRVRNREDGAVEIIAEGGKEKLNELVEWCRVGPPGARVTGVEIKSEPYTGEFKEFSIRYRR
jgi:acylphosphatase